MNYYRSVTLILVFSSFLTFISDAASDTMNKCKHPDGSIEFTDQPCPTDAHSSSIENKMPAPVGFSSKKNSADMAPLGIKNLPKKISIAPTQQNSRRIIATEHTDDGNLISAVGAGDCNKVQALLKSGISPNSTFTDVINERDFPIIFNAINHANLCVIKTLISFGADVNYIIRINENTTGVPLEYTPLSHAIMTSVPTNNIALFEVFLNNGAQIDLKASDGITFVQHAINSLTVLTRNNEGQKKILKEIERKLAMKTD